MRIHYLINGFNGGGAALPIPRLLGLMADRGHTVKVLGFMLQDGKALARFERANIDYEILGRGRWDIMGAWRQLIRRLEEDAPDLVWTSLTRATLFGQMAGKKLGIPVVSWQHSEYLKPANLFLLRRLHNLSCHWVTDSDTVREFTIRQLGVHPERVSTWPMFYLDPGAPQARPWPGEGPIRIGSLGQLHINKQYQCMVGIAARLQDTHPELSGRLEFVIGGVGPEQHRLQALISRRGLGNFRLAGFVDRPEEFLSELHIYLQTSHHEGLCLAAHEAMQAGLPVVATRVGQLRQSIIDRQTGILCDVGDVQCMTQATLLLADDPARAYEMGQAGRARVESLFGKAAFEQRGNELLARLESGLKR